MPTYKLQYFDARGVAETIRYMFAVAKVEYEDARFPLTFGTPGDFSTMTRKEFDEAKASGELACSAGKVPYLEVDGVKVGQSKAIERFLAKELGLAGDSALQFLQIDAICEQVRDIKEAYNNCKRGKEGAEKEAALATWFGETLPADVKKMEGMIPANKGPFLFGEKISLADLTVFQFLAAHQGFYDNTEGAKASFQACAAIKSAMEATAENEGVKAWIEKRPKTDI
mmetsp:Transcript_127482/g.271827  ORF Transcript_127482/g.271827 Transcript_127482/m.271827 type:complete len:227 (-) Transcript_127482:97-777(-)